MSTTGTSFVSSEFQNPLTAAKGSLETVLRHWSTLDENRRLALVTRALRGCEDLVGALGQLQDFEGAGPSKRWKLESLAVERAGLGTKARVVLEHSGVALSGESHVRAGPSLAYEGVVEACLRAVEHVLPIRLEAQSADVLEVEGTKVAVVCLTSGGSPLVGSAPVRLDDYDAVARATLAAMNRVLAGAT